MVFRRITYVKIYSFLWVLGIVTIYFVFLSRFAQFAQISECTLKTHQLYVSHSQSAKAIIKTEKSYIYHLINSKVKEIILMLLHIWVTHYNEINFYNFLIKTRANIVLTRDGYSAYSQSLFFSEVGNKGENPREFE